MVTAVAARERAPNPHRSGLQSRLHGYGPARGKAVEILAKEGPWHEQTDMDPLGSLLEGLPNKSDVVEDIAGHIASGNLPVKDNVYYARCAIPHVEARREGNSETASINAVRDRAGLDGAHSTVEADIKEAKRRGFAEAVDDVLDAGEELVPDAVLFAARLRAIRAGDVNLARTARCLLRLVGSLEPRQSWLRLQRVESPQPSCATGHT